ncbi:MAG: biotin/lipoyl-containing protein [Lactovum sp.]
MLRKLKIRVDGKEYLVEVEEEGVAQTALISSSEKLEVKPVASEQVIEKQDVKNITDSSNAMIAPMPGTIGNILVAQGDHVEINQPVLILEAMKMENQIVADKTGIVQGIHVSNGATVNPGDALITIIE